MVKFVQSYNKLKTDIKSIPDFLASLKNIRKDDIEQYKYWVEYVIDCLKYDIENINFKTIDQRKKERIEKAKQIQEIPNLIDLINV